MTLIKRTLSPAILLACVVLLGISVVTWLGGGTGQPDTTPSGLSPESAQISETARSTTSAPLLQDAADASTAFNANSSRRAVTDDLRANLNLGAAEGVLLEGLVIEAEGGAPIAGAQLQVGGETWVVEGESNAAGQFQLRLPVAEGAALAVNSTGYAPLRRPHAVPGETLTLELQKEGRIHGTIEGAARAAAKDARVLLWDMRGDPASDAVLAEVLVDDQGSFQFGGLASGEYQLCAFVTGFGFEFAHGVAVTTGEVQTLALHPSLGASVRGQVLYKESVDPVVGATVSATPDIQGLGPVVEEHAVRTTRTDAEGRYELSGLPLGKSKMLLETEWGGRTRASLLVQEAAESLEHDFELQLPASLEGVVQNDSAQGVGMAEVRLSWEGARAFDPPEAQAEGTEFSPASGFLVATADINGRFQFESLPAGRTLHLIAFRGPQDSSDLLQADVLSQTVELRLRSGEERKNFELSVHSLQTVSGVVRDELGQPIPGAPLSVMRSKSKKTAARFHSNIESDEQGRFEIVGLLRGRYTLKSECSGFLTRSHSFNVLAPPAAQPRLELVLPEAGAVRGFVVDEWGNSISHARVRAASGIKRTSTRSRNVRADEYGRFEFEALEPGLYAIGAKARGFLATPTPHEQVETGAASPLVLELERDPDADPCSIIGRLVTTNGGALKGLRLESPKGGVLKLNGDRFEVQGVRAGNAKLRLHAPGYLKTKLLDLILSAGSQTDVGAVMLYPAGELEVFARNADRRMSSGFTARLTSTDPPRPGVRQPTVPLYRVVRRHRWQGKGKTRSVKAAYSEQVPLGTWKLEVSQAGHKPWSKILSFNAVDHRHVIEVQLKKAKATAKKRKKKK